MVALAQPGAEDGRARDVLALSGGGYRAMLFHTGVLWRLCDAGVLPRLQRISSVLRDEGPVIVGFHPEGKRNREPSPYTPLPAQPGAGKIVMDSWPVIVPAFINGLTNNIAADIVGNFRGTRTVVAVFGEPINLAPFQKLGDRLTSHKRIADAMLKTIYALGEEERAFRATLPARP